MFAFGIVLGGLFGLSPVCAVICAQKKFQKRNGNAVGFSYVFGLIVGIGLPLLIAKIGVDINVAAFFVTAGISHAFWIFREILS
jgi:hypothetical protein